MTCFGSPRNSTSLVAIMHNVALMASHPPLSGLTLVEAALRCVSRGYHVRIGSACGHSWTQKVLPSRPSRRPTAAGSSANATHEISPRTKQGAKHAVSPRQGRAYRHDRVFVGFRGHRVAVQPKPGRTARSPTGQTREVRPPSFSRSCRLPEIRKLTKIPLIRPHQGRQSNPGRALARGQAGQGRHPRNPDRDSALPGAHRELGD